MLYGRLDAGQGLAEALSTLSRSNSLFAAATNLMAISIANRNQSQANETLSDAIGIALLFGLVFGLITYIVAPSVLQTMTSSTSTQMVEPASIYVRIRSVSQFKTPPTTELIGGSDQLEHRVALPGLMQYDCDCNLATYCLLHL